MTRIYLGLDVGGTKTAAGVVTAEGKVLTRQQAPTAELREGGDPLTALIRLGRDVLAPVSGRRLEAVGIALPGPTDRNGIRMLAAPTIPEFQGVPLGPALSEAFDCPAAGDNDANGCALAEARFGAGRGYRHVIYVTVSTGIGGGIVLDGRVQRGATGTAAEIGHQVLQPVGGPPCDCGSTGCLEALASGRGIARRAREAWAANPNRPEGGCGTVLTAAVLAEAARQGDLLACRVWADTALYLGLGLANVINLFDPDVVVLGGGVALGATDLLLDPVRQVVRERCMPSLARETPIVAAALDQDLGILSAVCVAREALEE